MIALIPHIKDRNQRINNEFIDQFPLLGAIYLLNFVTVVFGGQHISVLVKSIVSVDTILFTL